MFKHALKTFKIENVLYTQNIILNYVKLKLVIVYVLSKVIWYLHSIRNIKHFFFKYKQFFVWQNNKFQNSAIKHYLSQTKNA